MVICSVYSSLYFNVECNLFLTLTFIFFTVIHVVYIIYKYFVQIFCLMNYGSNLYICAFCITGCPTIEFSLCFCYFVGFYTSEMAEIIEVKVSRFNIEKIFLPL